MSESLSPQFTTVTSAQAHKTLRALHGEEYTGAVPHLTESGTSPGHLSALADAMTQSPSGEPIRNHERHNPEGTVIPNINATLLEEKGTQQVDRDKGEKAKANAGKRASRSRSGGEGEEAVDMARLADSEHGEEVDLKAEGLNRVGAGDDQSLPWLVNQRNKHMRDKEAANATLPTSVGDDGVTYANHLDVVKAIYTGTRDVPTTNGGKPRKSRAKNADGKIAQSRGGFAGVSEKTLRSTQLGTIALEGFSPGAPPRARRALHENIDAVKEHMQRLPVSNQPRTAHNAVIPSETPTRHFETHNRAGAEHVARHPNAETLYDTVGASGVHEPVTVIHHAGGGLDVPDSRHRAMVAAAVHHSGNIPIQFKHVFDLGLTPVEKPTKVE